MFKIVKLQRALHVLLCQVTIKSSSEEDLRCWSGFCHSRLRRFVHLSVGNFLKARIWPEAQEPETKLPDQYVKYYYIGVRQYSKNRHRKSPHTGPRKVRYDLREPFTNFLNSVRCMVTDALAESMYQISWSI